MTGESYCTYRNEKETEAWFSFDWSWKMSCGTKTQLFDFHLEVGSGSLSSPMREHWNFAQFYCISVTNFSTVSECILLEIIWIKGTYSSHSYGCFYVCMQCTSKNRQLIFYGRCLSGADHAVRDLNENSRCVYPLSDKAIRVLHSNMWYHWIGNWMPIPVV